MKSDLGIYVHLPFCARKCDYCDFVSQTGDESMYRAYAEALHAELLSYEHIWSTRPLATLYLGGGTPSVFPVQMIKHMLAPILQRLEPSTEFTIEVNPESVDESKAVAWKALGVNRISMGVQSTDRIMLKHLGRLHSRERIFTSYDILRCHFANINLDLMYALADDDSTYLQSLKELLALKPQHFSTYALEVYSHLPLAGKQQNADEESSFNQFHNLRHLLEKHGYERYEVSNFALAGFNSRHNLRYWKRLDTLGLGVSAHGLIGEERTRNTDSVQCYLQCPLDTTLEHLSEEEQAFEVWMLGLRTASGVDLERFIEQYPHYPLQKALTKHLNLGNLIQEGGFIRPNTQGFDLLNQVILDFMK